MSKSKPIPDLKRLTVSQVRTKYWSTSTNSGKPIKCQIFQDYHHHHDQVTLTPLGLLLEQRYQKKGAQIATNKRTSHYTENWLSQSKSGPYKKSDVGQKQSSFYFLAFISNKEPGKIIWLQVCSGPLNALSRDCLDDVGVWIKK